MIYTYNTAGARDVRGVALLQVLMNRLNETEITVFRFCRFSLFKIILACLQLHLLTHLNRVDFPLLSIGPSLFPF